MNFNSPLVKPHYESWLLHTEAGRDVFNQHIYVSAFHYGEWISDLCEEDQFTLDLLIQHSEGII